MPVQELTYQKAEAAWRPSLQGPSNLPSLISVPRRREE